jgi:hypothetical protein
MTPTGFDHLERELRAGVRRHHSAATRPWRRPSVLALAGALVIAGTALAATTPWNPQVGDDHRGRPRLSSTPVPADQLAVLAALRRPQTDTDRGLRVEAVLKLVPGMLFSGVRLDSARLLLSWKGGAAMLLSVEHFGPTGSRAKTLPHAGMDDAICLLISSDYMTVGKNGTFKQVFMPSAGGTCTSLGNLRADGLFTGADITGRLQLTGVVPDGVARVEVRLRHRRTVGAPVVNNAFRIEARVPRSDYLGPQLRWLDRTGRVIHKVNRL